jgi:hypothetical protein
MRYRRSQEKAKLIEEIIDIYHKIPNHSVQFTDDTFYLESWDAIKRKPQKKHLSDLKNMSNQQLKELIKTKKWQLAGENLVNLLFNNS